jgi:hypothetical protein
MTLENTDLFGQARILLKTILNFNSIPSGGNIYMADPRVAPERRGTDPGLSYSALSGQENPDFHNFEMVLPDDRAST